MLLEVIRFAPRHDSLDNVKRYRGHLERLVCLHMQVCHKCIGLKLFDIRSHVSEHLMLFFEFRCQLETEGLVTANVCLHAHVHAVYPIDSILCFSQLVILFVDRSQNLFPQFVGLLFHRFGHLFAHFFNFLICIYWSVNIFSNLFHLKFGAFHS